MFCVFFSLLAFLGISVLFCILQISLRVGKLLGWCKCNDEINIRKRRYFDVNFRDINKTNTTCFRQFYSSNEDIELVEQETALREVIAESAVTEFVKILHSSQETQNIH